MHFVRIAFYSVALCLLLCAPSLASGLSDISTQELQALSAKLHCDQDYAFPTACEIVQQFTTAGLIDLEQIAGGALVGVSYKATPGGGLLTPELAALAVFRINAPPDSVDGQRMIEANINAIRRYNLNPQRIQRPVAYFYTVSADSPEGQDAIRETLRLLVHEARLDRRSDLFKSLQNRLGLTLFPAFSTDGTSTLIAQDNAVLLRRKGDWVYAIEAAWITGARAVGPAWIAAFKIK